MGAAVPPVPVGYGPTDDVVTVTVSVTVVGSATVMVTGAGHPVLLGVIGDSVYDVVIGFVIGLVPVGPTGAVEL